MKLESLTITNFRCYAGEQTVDFSKGLTLFLGDNGDGKSTLFDALYWLFHPEDKTSPLKLFSRYMLSKMVPGDEQWLSVEVRF